METSNNTANNSNTTNSREEKTRKLKKLRRWQIVVSLCGVAIIVAGLIEVALLFFDYKSTEVSNDAQIEQYISPVNLRASGYIKKICFTEHQEVHKGDTLLITAPLEGDGVRRLCDAVAQTCLGRCVVFAGTDGAYRYAVIHAGQDIRPLVKDMNDALHGRGGGRDGFAQGSAACTAAEIQAFFARR